MPAPNTSRLTSSGGFTLVEVMLAVALMGIAMTAALSGVAYAARDRRITSEMRLGHTLAASLAREIMSQRFADPQGVTAIPVSTNRSTFNNISDYAGYSQSPPKQRDGTAIAEATGWTRTVDIEPAYASNNSISPTQTASPTFNLYRITVTAKSPSGKTYSVAVYRSAFGVPDASTPATGLVTGLTVTITSGAQTASANIDPKNQPIP